MNKNCLICGSNKNEIVYQFDIDNVNKYKDSNDIIVPLFEKYGKLKIVKCSICGFGFVSPKFEDNHFNPIYEGDYWTDYQTDVGEIDIRDRINEFVEISKERLDFLQPFISAGKLLDIGCSMGFLVDEGRKVGFDSYGIDLNHYCINKGKEMFDANLQATSIEKYDNDNFDVILTFNTIEHVSNPDNFIFESSKRLKPNGLLVIGTHDFDCINHMIDGRDWKHIMPSEHLYYFTEKSLALLGKNFGFTKIYSNKPIDNLVVCYFRKNN